MSFKRTILNLLLTALLLSGCTSPQPQAIDPQASARVMQWATTHLSHQGILKIYEGYVYLKVDNGYVDQLYPMLELSPGYHKLHNPHGAHITVVEPWEKKRSRIDEVGQAFNFTPTNLKIFNTKRKSWVVLIVDAPELKQLREKHGLSPLPDNAHSFHISIAEKKFKRHMVMEDADFLLEAIAQ